MDWWNIESGVILSSMLELFCHTFTLFMIRLLDDNSYKIKFSISYFKTIITYVLCYLFEDNSEFYV